MLGIPETTTPKQVVVKSLASPALASKDGLFLVYSIVLLYQGWYSICIGIAIF